MPRSTNTATITSVAFISSLPLKPIDVTYEGFNLFQIRREQCRGFNGRIVLLLLTQIQQGLERSGIGAQLAESVCDVGLPRADIGARQQQRVPGQHTES